jgi:hypothetical protein
MERRMVSDNMESAMEMVRMEARPEVASAGLNIASGSGLGAPAESSRADNAQQVSSDAEVRLSGSSSLRG